MNKRAVIFFLLLFAVVCGPGFALTDWQGFSVEHVHWTVVEGSDETLRVGFDFGMLVLSFNENTFSFQCEERKHPCLYKLEGFDADWLPGRMGIKTSYYNVESGQYVFRLKSVEPGVLRGLSISLKVRRSWWNRPLTLILFCFLSLALLFFYMLWYRHLQKKKIRERSVIRETERRAKEAELRANVARSQTRVVSQESEQKSQELLEARKFQLSMLPKTVPDLPHLDIAVSTQPATEVGGDYYDFRVGEDGVLFVVCGDATGHGLKAGTMLSVIKTLVVSDEFGRDFSHFFNRCSDTIKKVGLKNLHMALTVLRIEDYKLTVSSAGMPPTFVYRKESNLVESVLLKGPPLGALKKFDYRCDYISVEPGDAVLVLTDGLPELFNRDKKMFGYDRVRESFREQGEKSAEEIVAHLNKCAEQWLNYKSRDDDMTMVVIKFK